MEFPTGQRNNACVCVCEGFQVSQIKVYTHPCVLNTFPPPLPPPPPHSHTHTEQKKKKTSKHVHLPPSDIRTNCKTFQVEAPFLLADLEMLVWLLHEWHTVVAEAHD